MHAKDKFTKTEFLARVAKGKYKTLAYGFRLLRNAHNLSGSDRTECRRALRDLLEAPKPKAKRTVARIPTRASVGAFLHLKSKLESAKYKDSSYFKRAVARSSGLTEQEKNTLRKAGEEFFGNGGTPTVVVLPSRNKRPPMGALFDADQCIELTLLSIVYDKEYMTKTLNLLRASANAGRTIIQLIEWLEVATTMQKKVAAR